MEFNTGKRKLEKFSAVFSLLINLILFLGSLAIIGALVYFWLQNKKSFTFTVLDFKLTLSTFEIGGAAIGIAVLSLICLVLSGILTKTPFYADGTLKSRTGVRVMLLILSIILQNYLVALLFIIVLLKPNYRVGKAGQENNNYISMQRPAEIIGENNEQELEQTEQYAANESYDSVNAGYENTSNEVDQYASNVEETSETNNNEYEGETDNAFDYQENDNATQQELETENQENSQNEIEEQPTTNAETNANQQFETMSYADYLKSIGETRETPIEPKQPEVKPATTQKQQEIKHSETKIEDKSVDEKLAQLKEYVRLGKLDEKTYQQMVAKFKK